MFSDPNLPPGTTQRDIDEAYDRGAGRPEGRPERSETPAPRSGRTAVFFDLETGGVEPHHPDIQLAAIAVDEASGAELEVFERKIQFEPIKADPVALELNHYTAEAWATAVPVSGAAAAFASFLNRHRSLQMVSKKSGRPYTVAKLVGHNAASFDGPRLQRMFRGLGMFLPADPRVRCTCQRAMWWFDEHELAPPDFKLPTLCKYFGIPVIESHEALADVRLTIALAGALTRAEVH